MSSALKIKKLEKEILTLSLIGLFSEKFERYINLKEQPTLTEMRETYNWIRDYAAGTVDPDEITELRRCWLKANQAFSRSKPLPAEIVKESRNLGRYLKDCYKHHVQTTNWEIQAGNFKIGRKVEKTFSNAKHK
jgi:hypothetical protein